MQQPFAQFTGIGETLSERLLKAFGTEDAFVAAAQNVELDRLTAVEGISTRKAVELVLQAQGRSPGDFLGTPRAVTLYEDILARVQAFANTDHARHRLALLVPDGDKKALKAHVDWVLEARDRVAKLPRDEVAKLLAGVHPLTSPRAKFDASVAVLVDAPEDYEALVAAGLDRYCQVLTPEDGGFNDGFEVIVYAYTSGLLDVTGADNVVSVPFQRDPAALVPSAVLQRYRANRDLLVTLGALAETLGEKSAAPEALAILDRATAQEVDFSTIEAAVNDAADWMNAELKRRMAGVALTGDDTLALMSGDTPKAVRDVQTEVFRAGRERLLEQTGADFAVFADGVPITVDENALERRRVDFMGRAKRDRFRDEVQAARDLVALTTRLEAEIQQRLEFDYAFALGSFALAYDLTAPRFGKGVVLQDALHLNLIEEGSGTRVDYALGAALDANGDDARVVLLTGANSGGKTTLMETVAQATLLAHLGLPVNAARAQVEIVDRLYFFTQRRSLDAGAFESFLRGFVPIVTSKSKKLVLADELEAMTELDAASRIVGTFIDLLHKSGSLGICVSHMAAEVSKHAQVRIDGIEARGLDEDFNLIVDRTPRMAHHARSTPELILRRLAAKSDGGEKKVYAAILAKFDEKPL